MDGDDEDFDEEDDGWDDEGLDESMDEEDEDFDEEDDEWDNHFEDENDHPEVNSGDAAKTGLDTVETPYPSTIRNTGDRVGRNDPCPCGSGKKYKKCCGG
jgi:preprotein translocase subunit SecA